MVEKASREQSTLLSAYHSPMPDTTMRMPDLEAIARQAMLDKGLLPDFAPAALKQLEGITQPAASGPGIRDLRSLLWSSIDNDDSRDLDQIEVAEALPGDACRILVAIADVDSTVAVGSPLDDHARANTTSVYTAAKIFPMLPEKLSTDLTSLGESQDRLAIVIEFTVTADGSLSSSDVYRALVRNRAKLAYDGVGAWLIGTAAAPARITAVAGMDQQLRMQDQAAQRLRKVRQTRGALTLQTIEARAVFDDGILTDLRPDEPNRAKELIEDFMIAANGVVARFLAAKGLPALRRVLRSPEHWDRIVALASARGGELPAAPDAAALNRFLAAQRQAAPASFPDLSLSVIKLLGSGEYQVETPGGTTPGHFGLAVSDYTHSTAPNRRFPDVITQRILKAALAGSVPAYSLAELETLEHCTSQEDNAKKVERLVQKSAAAFLLASRIGRQFDAVVTGASDKGTWVRISDPIAEGKVIKGADGMKVGDKVRVQLLDTDPARGFIDFGRTR
jgi:VacB/RNase II family 3'-5' exoribonuclease